MIIRQHLVPSTVASKVTSGKGNTRKKICIHETDNTNAKANADAHARLQYNGNSRQASWHWTVDDKEAVQSFTHDYKCWAAGTSKGNNEAIHIEICVNSDGDYRKAVQNAVQLVVKILKEEKLTINDVVQHNYYSGKNCPRIIRGGTVIPWSSFIQMVKSTLAPSTTSTVEDKQRKRAIALIKNAVATKVFTSPHEGVDKYTDDQLFDYVMTYAERLLK